MLGKGRATITRWLVAYRTGGIEALLKRGYLGKEPALSPEDINVCVSTNALITAEPAVP